MKKQILVIMPGAMELGGVERSLIGLLSAVDYTQYDVDLFVYGHHGVLFEHIDSRVNILPQVNELAFLRDSMKQKLKNGCYYSALLRVRDMLLSPFKKTNFDKTWAQVMRHCVKPLPKTYDAVWSFFLPFDFMTEMTTSAVKVGWIHTDYSYETDYLESLRRQYAKCDTIAAVSDTCAQAFIKSFPEYKDRVITVGNCLPASVVRKDAEKTVEEFRKGGITLLSIGRYCTAKNFDNVPDICARLLEMGLDVYWYIIGFGPDEELIRQRIQEAGMEERVILLGKKENPYPYIAACDLYVQPSRYEGKAVTVCEAQMLGKPVAIAAYATSGSQLEDGVDGVIVPQDNEGCAAGIAAFLRDPARMEKLAQNCRERDYSNANEVEKLYALM